MRKEVIRAYITGEKKSTYRDDKIEIQISIGQNM